jgi:aspartyl-tRNA(Asn)/glutamyl-tRNA(Gln) amidotransferase subunit A
VADAAKVLSAMSGPDPLDSTTVERPPVSVPTPRADLKGVRIGLPRQYFPADLDPGVRVGLDRAIKIMRDLGANVVDVSLPHAPYSVPTYYIINPAEASANLARYDGVRYGNRKIGPEGDLRALYRATRGEGFGPEVRRRILVGTYVLSAGYYDAYYRKAQQVRALLAEDFRQVFAPGGVDFLFTPTTPSTAFKAGEKVDDPVQMYLADVFVCGISLVGLPAMSVPVGRDAGLPIGGQIIAPAYQDEAMLGVAMTLERALPATEEVRP